MLGESDTSEVFDNVSAAKILDDPPVVAAQARDVLGKKRYASRLGSEPLQQLAIRARPEADRIDHRRLERVANQLAVALDGVAVANGTRMSSLTPVTMTP